MKKQKFCNWQWREDVYKTSCGYYFSFNDLRDIEQEAFRYCPYCSGRIVDLKLEKLDSFKFKDNFAFA